MKRILAAVISSVFVFLLLNFGAEHLTGNKLVEQSVQAEVSLVLGNPSNASSDSSNPDNYLVAHNGFVLSYNKIRGSANWVTWHLSKSDIGSTDRTEAFAPDTTLPKDWWVKPNVYTNSGYDKGHLCPSKDRSDTEENNRESFLMSNMQPQTPELNRKTWRYLEDYTRDTVKQNKEAYIYAGCYGDKGKIKDAVVIPTNCFKIIVVLTNGNNDLKRINRNTRIIAVDMPNETSLSTRWHTYLTTVDYIEEKTGYDFLSTVSEQIQSVVESKKDN